MGDSGGRICYNRRDPAGGVDGAVHHGLWRESELGALRRPMEWRGAKCLDRLNGWSADRRDPAVVEEPESRMQMRSLACNMVQRGVTNRYVTESFYDLQI